MSECKKVHELFMDGLYNRLNAEQKKVLENHLRLCEKCGLQYSEMEETLQVMRERIRPEPEASFWEGYWDKMTVRLREEVTPPLSGKSRQKWRYQFLPVYSRWVFQSAVALVILVIGIYVGKTIFNSRGDINLQSQTHHGLRSQSNEQAELMTRASTYVERSKRILLAIMNFDPEQEDSFALDLPFKQQISRDLIQEASYLKSELSVAHQNRLRNLVTELERILLQIANLESEHNLDSIELIKGGLDWQGVLLKIHLSDMREAKRASQLSVPQDDNGNFGRL